MHTVKMLAIYEKTPQIRHVGHLDLMRAMQRALRRSGIPVAFSQGFNPHLLVTFAAPLSVGMSGKREIMEVPLSAEIGEEEFKKKLRSALPPALPCIAARSVDDRHPAPMALLEAASYTIRISDDSQLLLAAIPGILRKESIMELRRTKSGEKLTDIRQMILDLNPLEGDTFACTLSLSEKATCKPELLLSALTKEAGLQKVPHIMCTRTQLWGKGMVPLELL